MPPCDATGPQGIGPMTGRCTRLLRSASAGWANGPRARQPSTTVPRPVYRRGNPLPREAQESRGSGDPGWWAPGTTSDNPRDPEEQGLDQLRQQVRRRQEELREPQRRIRILKE